MKKYVGAIDQGTTSSRFILFDQSARIVASHQIEHRQIFPAPGYVEHDPIEIKNNVLKCIYQTLKKAEVSAEEIAAIGITNQRETFVVWNKNNGKPYHNALVWQDTRSEKIVKRMAEKIGCEHLTELTGLPSASYFSASKLMWLLENMPEIRQAAKKGEALFGTMESWIIWWLTGGKHVTDISNASRTQMMELESGRWSEELLGAFDIPREILPRITDNMVSKPYGVLEIDGAKIPINAAFGDQQAALFGQGCIYKGDAKNTYGTGCFLLMNTGRQPVHSEEGLLSTVAFRSEGQSPYYAIEGSVAIAGALVQWLRDNLGLIEKSSDIETLAKSVKDNGDVYIVPAFSGLYAPYWRPDARGVITGLTRYANKGHIARAVLEAAAFQTLDIVRAMEKDTGIKISVLKTDGGMTVNETLMQFQSDILNIPVKRPENLETTALGAAFGAGLSSGFWKDIDDLFTIRRESREWQPKMSKADREFRVRRWHQAVEKSTGWV